MFGLFAEREVLLTPKTALSLLTQINPDFRADRIHAFEWFLTVKKIERWKIDLSNRRNKYKNDKQKWDEQKNKTENSRRLFFWIDLQRMHRGWTQSRRKVLFFKIILKNSG